VLYLESNEHLFVLGLEAQGGHQIFVCVFGDERSHGCRLQVRKVPMAES
jgi:hypothetical protein